MKRFLYTALMLCAPLFAQVDWPSQVANPPFLDPRTYQFTRTNGLGASGDLSASGAGKVITFAPCPVATFAADGSDYVYISGGTGTAEPVPITGSTCTSNASIGTITVTTANTHTGAWAVTSATAGIQEAVLSGSAVRIPAGSYTIHAPTTIPAGAYIIRGSSLTGTALTVAADFPAAVNGVFIGTATAGFGPQITDLSIAFTEPDSSNIATYTHWPAAFYMVGVTRFQLTHISVFCAWDVVTMTGNSGGAMIDDLQASFFDKGIQIDGSLDSVYLTKVRFWPYSLTANQTTVMQTNATTYGLYSARMDDLHVTDFFATCTVGMYFYQSGSGATNMAHLSNITLDSTSSMVVSAGHLNITNLIVSISTVGSFTGVAVSGGVVKINNALFYPGGSTSGVNPYVAVSSTGLVELSNSWFWSVNYDVSSITESAGILIATGNHFIRQANTSYTQATVNVSGGRVTFIGNRTADKGTGAGNLISISSDDYHQVRANAFIGWTASFPASIGSGVYETDSLAYQRIITAGAYNYISSETGSNNAIAGSLTGVGLNEGTMITIKLAHTLAAGGANTFNLNGLGAKGIYSHNNPSNNIATGYVVNGFLTVVYVGGVWQDISQ